jgi:tRNA dimethylallyltransferase
VTPSLVCITGTTGTGKNRIGGLIGQSIGGSVLSLDSMKVYRGMDIGTAKPDAELRSLCPHHLIDIVEPSERMDMSLFMGRAERIIADEQSASHPLICVGGTAMYLNGLLFGLQDTPPRDEDFRARLKAERDEKGVQALHSRLAAVDAASAERINPNDYQRIERALEILALTGKPAGDRERTWFGEMRFPAQVFVLTWPREVLRARIDRRVDQMFADGWVDEVRQILATGGFSETASRALGYPEIMALLDRGAGESETRQLIKTRTWQFAKRQLTWYRKFTFATTRMLSDGDTHESVAAEIRSALG